MTTLVPAEFEILDPRFRACRGDDHLQRIASGLRWAEGPVWLPLLRQLIWSDIPNDVQWRWDQTSGQAAPWRAPCGYSNGSTLDPQGRLLSCHHGWRSVTRIGHDGRVSVLADRYAGRRFNSPNDLVVARDGAIWFTDPSYGIDSDYEGEQASAEQDGCHVYRIDAGDGRVSRVADDFIRPNGLAFSIDGRQLYIADTRANHIRVFDVIDGSRLENSRVFAQCTNGVFDGLRLDSQGRIWAAAGDGVHCFDADGSLIGKLRVPETVSNLCFGGRKGNQLFITATSSVYTILLTVNGA